MFKVTQHGVVSFEWCGKVIDPYTLKGLMVDDLDGDSIYVPLTTVITEDVDLHAVTVPANVLKDFESDNSCSREHLRVDVILTSTINTEFWDCVTDIVIGDRKDNEHG